MQIYFIGTIIPWPGSFSPSDFLLCDGTIYPTTQYPALYALIGNQFGGDGKTTFAVPDLRNRITIGANGAQNMLGKQVGQIGQQTLPAITHTHSMSGQVTTALKIYNGPANAPSPASPNVAALPVRNSAAANLFAPNVTGDFDVGQLTMTRPAITGLGSAGVNSPQAVDTSPPVQALNFIICWSGTFPALQDN